MAAISHTPRWRVQDYLELERFSPVKHEYVEGYVYAMAGGTRADSVISTNILALLRDRARGGPCRVYNSDMKVRLTDAVYVYPDASVSCDARDAMNDEADHIAHPTLIVEVLSDSTADYDRGDKFELYRRNPAIQEYVLVDPHQAAVEVYRRVMAADAQSQWRSQRFGAGEDVAMHSLGFTLPLALVYEDVTFSVR